MHFILTVCLVIVGVALAVPEEKYTTQYDNIDLDEILSNERLYQKYYKCLIGEGKCTIDGKQLKDTIPDALKTDCIKCTEIQKKGSEKVLKFILEKKRADFDKLASIYDKEGIYLKKYKEEAKKRGVIIN